MFRSTKLASDHKCLRICDLCKELGITVWTRILLLERERQAKTDACLVPLCPLARRGNTREAMITPDKMDSRSAEFPFLIPALAIS